MRNGCNDPTSLSTKRARAPSLRTRDRYDIRRRTVSSSGYIFIDLRQFYNLTWFTRQILVTFSMPGERPLDRKSVTWRITVHTATVKNDGRSTKRLPLNRATGAIHHYLAERPAPRAPSIQLSPLALPHLQPFPIYTFRSMRLHYLMTAL